MKTIIFDIGYVLVDYDWNKYLHTIFSDEHTIEVVADALYNHGVWNELDRGVWTDEQLRRAHPLHTGAAAAAGTDCREHEATG